MTKLRLNKYISSSGLCSRRQADVYIQAGNVKINGKVVTKLGTTIDSEADLIVTVNGEAVATERKLMYVMLNKPTGYTVTKAYFPTEKTVMELLPQSLQQLKPVGRLDRDSEGLLLFTNDGDLAQQFTHPKFGHEKEYQVTVKEPLTPYDIKKLRTGIVLKEGNTGKAFVALVNKHAFNIVLTQGWKRQIRRMVQALNKQVVCLQRIRVNKLTLGKLAVGKWKMVTKEQLC
jgi:pseudouridine synthase